MAVDQAVDHRRTEPVSRVISVRHPDALTPSEMELWRSWQRADRRLSSPFLAPEFLTVLGRHDDRLRVATLGDEAGITGFLPFRLMGAKVGQALGYGLADVQALICPAGTRWDMDAVMHDCGLAVFEFEHLVGHQVEQISARNVELQPAPMVDLSPGWDAWFADKKATSKSRMRRVQQKRRQLDKEVGPVQFTFASTSHDDLDRLMAWKSAQYVRTGRFDRFAKPWFREFLHDLLSESDENFSIVLNRLDAGSETVAFDLGIRCGDVLAGWFPAYEPRFSTYSPGTVCMLLQVEAAAAAGITRIELGEGAAGYKESFKNGDQTVACGWSERAEPAAYVRRLVKGPRRTAERVVLSSPRLRTMARTTLDQAGRVRASVTKKS